MPSAPAKHPGAPGNRPDNHETTAANTLARYPSLADQVVLITGGASGIGAQFVRAFAAQGARVGFVDVNDSDADTVCDAVEAAGGARPLYVHADVTHSDGLRGAMVDAMDVLGDPLCLVNNVGNDGRQSPTDCTPQEWRQCLAVNLDSAFFASQAVLPRMQARGRGSIINMSSINAVLGMAQMPGYVTAKAGLIGMTRALAQDVGPHGVRVNAILPGWVATDRQLNTWLTEDAEAEWMQRVAIPKRLMPEDIARVALFLAADDSAMITGQQFTIDGGRT